MSEQKKFCVVRDAVLAEQTKRGIRKETLSDRSLPEGSCEMFGEGFNLVERQLMHTREGCGYWRNLRGDLLDLVFEYITQKFAHQ